MLAGVIALLLDLAEHGDIEPLPAATHSISAPCPTPGDAFMTVPSGSTIGSCLRVNL